MNILQFADIRVQFLLRPFIEFSFCEKSLLLLLIVYYKRQANNMKITVSLFRSLTLMLTFQLLIVSLILKLELFDLMQERLDLTVITICLVKFKNYEC